MPSPTAKLPPIVLEADQRQALHAQLATALHKAISAGELQPGERLPSVQKVAKTYGLSIGTVMRSFSDLARQGVLHARRGSGTFVAEPQVATTEVLIPSWFLNHCAMSNGLHEDLFTGLRSGFGSGERRFCTTHTDRGVLSGAELLAQCEARRVDSVVAIGAQWGCSDAVALASRHLPTVCIMPGCHVDGGDIVTVEIAGQLTELLEARRQQGVKEFTLIGNGFLVNSPDPASPYTGMLQEYQSTMLKFDERATIHLLSNTGSGAELEEIRGQLSPGSTIVTLSPASAHILDPAGEHFDIITFTESPATIERFRGAFSFLYTSITDTAAAAAKLLVERQRDGVDKPPRTITVRPRVIHKNGSET